MTERTHFLGLAFDPVGPEEAARMIATKARRLGPFAYVATPNVDHMVRLDRKPELRTLYSSAWLNLCDSRILELFAKFSNVKLPSAPGADIVELLFTQHIGAGDRIAIIGGTAELVRSLRARFALTDVRWFDAPHGLKDDAAARGRCVAFIRDNPSHYVFLAVGSPQQEMIAHDVVEANNAVGVAICCGAALEFLGGNVKRAPKWMRDGRIEWLHRLGAEPGRLWRRYLVDGPRIFGIWRKWRSAEAR